MEDKICLDTDFLVNFLKNKSVEIEFVKNKEFQSELATTTINLFELYYGAYKSDNKEHNLKILIQAVSRLNILNLSDNSARRAGEISAQLEKQGKPIDFRDILIGAIAQENGYSMKTYNIKDFSRIPTLEIVD